MSDATQKMKLSNQALGAVMMALQESLLNQLDIVPIAYLKIHYEKLEIIFILKLKKTQLMEKQLDNSQKNI